MILEEILIEKMKYFPNLFHLVDGKYKNFNERHIDFQKIRDEINFEYRKNINGVSVPSELTGNFTGKKILKNSDFIIPLLQNQLR